MAKDGCFWSGYLSWALLIFHSTVVKCLVWLKWVVDQLLVMYHCQNIGFPVIFSHFSHFLAKNGCFWSGYLSWVFLIFHDAVEKCRFWFKWVASQLLVMYHCQNIGFFLIFSHLSHFLAKNGCFWSSYLVQVFSILEIGSHLVEWDEI